jgi:hypothetical protein
MATNPIDNYMDGNQSGPAIDGIAITPNDSTDLVPQVRGIYVGGAGVLNVLTPRGTSLSFTCVAGGYVPFWVKRVLASGTTATLLVGAV